MKIALLGDMAFFGRMSVNENNRLVEFFADVVDYLKGFDYVVGNLETPFSIKKKPQGAKSAYICADVENVQIIRQLHINAVTLANNHMFDFGKEGYETTKKVLQDNGIEWFGAEGKELYVEKDDNKIAFSGFCCYTSNPLQCVPSGEYGVNAYSIPVAQQALKKNANKGYFNIMAVHAGLEHVNYPSIEHVRAARMLAKECPCVYYGHHPHVIQGVEEYHGSLIAHSLGNFCFDDVYTEKSSDPLVMLTENNRTGAILDLEIIGGKISSWKVQGIYISKNGKMKLLNQVNDMEKYSVILENCEENPEQFTSMRQQIISIRINQRKAARNLSWYIKRLRPKYVQIILNARNNAKKYQQNVLNYIKQNESSYL